MHSFIETERFAGLSLEAALRRLLSAFRLPGEAQKIDRIVEKFAERYCVENPGVFPIADAAYLLAFAIIMLNTDAHNPMAEGRLSQDDFVSMCTYQAEDGEFREILPPDEIKALYRNIVAEEIVLLGGEGVAAAAGAGTGSAPGSASKGKKGKEPGKLAAAVGLGQMSGPFWAGNAWDKQHGVDVERRRLLEVTAQLFDNSPGGGAGASLWRAATHAEHARPMMQVCGGAVAKALGAALSRAPSVQEAAPILYSYDQAIRLAALLYLEPLCEKLVSDLAAAASITSPAPPHTPLEARQVASLSRLISLGSCSEAGSLGSSWIYILRVLSDLEALKTSLSPASAPGGAQGGGAATAGSAEDSSAAGISSMGRLFARMGLSSTAAPPAASTTVVSERAGRRGPVAVREAPGMGAVIWAETVGAGLIDRTFAHSARLDGDAVLTFMRALCAASQEELDPGVPGAPPRVYLLNRVVECAFANGDRIRLVWQRLWTVVSQHLVSAACHPDQYVAMYAVEALRQLADKVLCRAELAGFSSQGDALRPFTAVLRGSDAAAVRELSTACIARAVDAHSARIGSGWRTVLEALGTAACDPSEAVVTQALDALAVVFGALYEPQGHACLAECVTAAMAAVGNPAPAAADLTTTGLYLFQAS